MLYVYIVEENNMWKRIYLFKRFEQTNTTPKRQTS